MTMRETILSVGETIRSTSAVNTFALNLSDFSNPKINVTAELLNRDSTDGFQRARDKQIKYYLRSDSKQHTLTEGHLMYYPAGDVVQHFTSYSKNIPLEWVIPEPFKENNIRLYLENTLGIASAKGSFRVWDDTKDSVRLGKTDDVIRTQIPMRNRKYYNVNITVNLLDNETRTTKNVSYRLYDELSNETIAKGTLGVTSGQHYTSFSRKINPLFHKQIVLELSCPQLNANAEGSFNLY